MTKQSEWRLYVAENPGTALALRAWRQVAGGRTVMLGVGEHPLTDCHFGFFGHGTQDGCWADGKGEHYCSRADVDGWNTATQFWWVCWGANWLEPLPNRAVSFKYPIGVDLGDSSWWAAELTRMFAVVIAIGDEEQEMGEMARATGRLFDSAERAYYAKQVSRESLLLAYAHDAGVVWNQPSSAGERR